MKNPEDMYLQNRQGVWYFRRRIPEEVKCLVDRGLFQFSLKTRSRADAVSLLPEAMARSTVEITRAKGRMEAAATEGRPKVHPGYRQSRALAAQRAARKRSKQFEQYTEAEINNLLVCWFDKARKRADTVYADAFGLNGPEEREEFLQELYDLKGCLFGQRPPMDDMIISREVATILDEEDCAPPSNWLGDGAFRRFYGLVAAGLIHLNQRSITFLETGQMVGETGCPVFHWEPVSNRMEPTGISLKDLIKQFEAEPRRAHLREATKAEYNLIYRALREQIGESRPICTITREDIKAVADTFLHLPSRATLTSKQPLFKIAEAAKANGAPQAHPKTYNKKVHGLSAIFRYAVIEQLLTQNPAQNLAVQEPFSSGEGKGFNSEQLQTIFSGRLFTQFLTGEQRLQFVPNHTLRPCFFWSPLIALFHGARSGEILQIKTANVFEQEGVYAVKIEGIVKNISSFRVFPIHPELKRLGFLQYVKAVRDAGHKNLFPDAKLACDKKFSTWFQKPFGNYLRGIGVKTAREQTFHAFRHTCNEGMRRADIPEEIRKAICGWKRKDASSEARYGGQDLPRLLGYLQKLEYPGLNLAHLYPEKKTVRTTHG